MAETGELDDKGDDDDDGAGVGAEDVTPVAAGKPVEIAVPTGVPARPVPPLCTFDLA